MKESTQQKRPDDRDDGQDGQQGCQGRRAEGGHAEADEVRHRHARQARADSAPRGGLGALPAPFTLQQFLGRVGTVFLQFPISGAISLVVCAAATGIVMLILRPFERKQS